MSAVIERQLNSALDRLIAGKPRTESVKERLLKCRPITNGVCLEEESGHNRSLFAHANCNYPKIYARLLGLRKCVSPSSAVKSLKAQITSLSTQLAQQKTISASLAAELAEIQEREARAKGNRFRRRDKRRK